MGYHFTNRAGCRLRWRSFLRRCAAAVILLWAFSGCQRRAEPREVYVVFAVRLISTARNFEQQIVPREIPNVALGSSLTPLYFDSEKLEYLLADSGLNGDIQAGDRIYSLGIPVRLSDGEPLFYNFFIPLPGGGWMRDFPEFVSYRLDPGQIPGGKCVYFEKRYGILE